MPLRQLLTDRVGIPAFVDNDATVAALAEAHDDDLNLIAASLVMITVGTGVGGGIVIDGRIYRGVTGAAPELGHIIVAADLTDGAPPRAARQPHHASLEYMAAGRALDRLGEARGLGDGTAVVAAARNGDPDARECMRILGERLGVGIANVVNIFDPELVVIGGGVSVAGELLLDPAKESAARFILPGVGTQTRIELARYGPQAGRPRSSAARRAGAGTRRPSPPSRDHEGELTPMATQQVNERLAALTAAGTSVWLDQIKRALITTGELQRLVEEDSLRGVTSNPTIFNQAILGSDDYDEQLAEAAREGLDDRGIYQELAIRDIQDACDVLRVVYDESGGKDGFVSFEVDPDLAFDTDRTMEQAREYWDRVDRPNLMIKIPGTEPRARRRSRR